MRRKILALIAALLAIAVASAILMQRQRQPNVLVLLVDTLRADHLSYFGYQRQTSPTLDAFARENIAYSWCFAASSWTPSSVASLFTGRYPSAHGMMPPNDREEARAKASQLSAGLQTLAEHFQQNGYRTAAVISNPWLKEHFGYNQGFQRYSWVDRVEAAKVNAEGIRLLKELKNNDAPFFLYLHYMDPHNPYAPPAAYRELFRGPLQSRSYPPKQERYIGLYDGEIRYFDDELRDFFAYLRAQDLYDDAVILILSDHGEQFMERGNQGHGYALYNEELRVPCFLKADGHNQVISEPVSLVDFFPTLTDAARLPPPPGVQGLSVLSGARQRSGAPLLAEVRRVSNRKGLVSPQREKLLLDYDLSLDLLLPENAEPSAHALYDLARDYGETAPLENAQRRSELTAEFNRAYEQTRTLRNSMTVSEAPIDPDTIKELESLGYLQ